MTRYCRWRENEVVLQSVIQEEEGVWIENEDRGFMEAYSNTFEFGQESQIEGGGM